MLVVMYMAFGYWAHYYINRDKVYFYSPGALFRHRMAMGTFLGWALIPIAILKLFFGRR